MGNTAIVKIGSVELTEQDAVMICSEGKYVITYKKIYAVAKKTNGSIYGRLIYTSKENLTRRGRFFVWTAKQVNDLLGFELIKDGEAA